MPIDSEQSIPFIGDRFPDVTVQTTLGELSLPAAYRGHWFILFSHPGDFTPVCTTEYVAFEKHRHEFQRLNTHLIGLSIDQVFSHIKWIEWIHRRLGVQITFPIIDDGLGMVARRLGLVHPSKGTRTVRSVYIVDPEGVIRIILTYPETVGRNIFEIRRAVQALQATDAHQAATPANWPNNEIVGDKLILPPARTVQEADERKAQSKAGQLSCFDWWFCTNPSLYEKLGGEKTITMVVDYFYDLVLADNTINYFFKNSDIETQRRLQTQFLSYLLGGPNQYTGKSMVKAHEGMNLQPEHLNAMLKHLHDAFVHFGVHESDTHQVLTKYASLRDQILYK